MTREELLEKVSFMCAREVKNFGDLTPMEVEAFLRDLYSTAKSNTHKGEELANLRVEVAQLKEQLRTQLQPGDWEGGFSPGRGGW